MSAGFVVIIVVAMICLTVLGVVHIAANAVPKKNGEDQNDSVPE